MTATDVRTREEPKAVLQEREVHLQWISHFRGRENQPFYDLAFDYIAQQFGPAAAADAVVDAGCGSGTKSMHLARRGYRVLGLDISDSMLEEARAAAAREGLERLEFRRADLTQIPLPSHSVTRAICWGVLMHIPDVATAVAELARIMAPGGVLIVSEGNKRSMQAVGLRTLKRLLRRERAEILHTPAGIEFWEQTSSGRFMTRQADVRAN